MDQPINCGLSYTDTGFLVNNTFTAGDHMVNFFYNFFQRHSEWKQNPIYIFGESYAGHYVPHFTARLFKNSTFADLNIQVLLFRNRLPNLSLWAASFQRRHVGAPLASPS